MFVRVLMAALLLGALPHTEAQAWHPAPSPLMTRWAGDVSPTNAHPEYPRPQMTRPNWQSLNGLWDYAIASLSKAQPATYPGKILVPYPIQAPLSGVKKPVFPAQRLWYHRTFTVPAAWRQGGQRVLLHFDAANWKTTVTLNGKPLGTHQGGYDAFSYDVTDALKPGDAAQALTLSVFNPMDHGDQPRGKEVAHPEGIFYTASTGLWQSVWLEPVPLTHISGLVITPDVDDGCLRITVQTEGPSTVSVTAQDGPQSVGAVTGMANQEIRVPITNPHLWSPDDPHLYNLHVSLGSGGDSVDSYFAMRKVERKSDGLVSRILLNGQFVFQVGALDQGYWPDGIYTAPTDDALRSDIETAKTLGFDVLRKHQKVEPERWYYWADKLGMLVWQDMPRANNDTPAGQKEFEAELRRMVQGRYNHPSIIQWVLFDEGNGEFDDARLTQLVHQLDPTRLVDDASGGNDQGVGDVIDLHNYPDPASPTPTPDRAAVTSEYGGLSTYIPDHVWPGVGRYLIRPPIMQDGGQLTRRYARDMRRAYALKNHPGLSAIIFTQLTDVEGEINGLLTYDRAVVKPDVAQVAAASRGHFPPAPASVLPTAEDLPGIWRYTTTTPSDDWSSNGFDASGWKSGTSGFGQGQTGTANTSWTTPDIWLRREFTLPDPVPQELVFRASHNEDMQIYVNGVFAASVPGFSPDYIELPLIAEARAALKPGKNVIAVHCHQTHDRQFIDVGLVPAGAND